MKKLCFLSALALTACGGSGGSNTQSSSISSTPASATAVQEPVYFREVKNALPSLDIYYQKTCGSAANSFLVPPIDVNKDGRKDFFIVLWCQSETGALVTGPVKNTVVALIQNNDGTYRLGNQEVFGKDYVEITGSLGELADIGIADFNNDGKEDIAFSPSLEDGRKLVLFSDGTHSWQTTPVVFLSQPNGGYIVDTVGAKGTYESLAIIKSANGDKFVSGGYIWSYKTDKWVGELITYKLDRTSIFYDNNVTMAVTGGSKFGWQIGTIQSQNFVQSDYLHISDSKLVEVFGDTTRGNTLEYLISVDGVDYVAPAYNSICTIPSSNSSEFTVVAEFQGIKLTEKYTGQKLEWTTPGKNGNVDNANYRTKLMAFKISGNKVSKVDVPAFNKDIVNGLHIACMDVNNDKQQDVVLYRWGHNQEKPYVYLNNNGNFTEVSLSKLPDISTAYHGHTMMFSDMNNDGKSEIIYAPGLGYKKDYAGNYTDYQYFRAENPL